MSTRMSQVKQAALRGAQRLRFIVLQVKCDRVLHFTDNAAYQPPSDADWCCDSSRTSPLPKDMARHICRGRRFKGGVSRDARANAPAPTAQRLFDHNRQTWLRLSKKKIELERGCLSIKHFRAVHVQA